MSFLYDHEVTSAAPEIIACCVCSTISARFGWCDKFATNLPRSAFSSKMLKIGIMLFLLEMLVTDATEGKLKPILISIVNYYRY